MINASGWPSLSKYQALLQEATLLDPADVVIDKLKDFLRIQPIVFIVDMRDCKLNAQTGTDRD